MNWLFALIAFAPLMAVLSTIVTVSVELIHKTFQLRRHGLEESLRALHDGVIVPLESGEQPLEEHLYSNGRTVEAAKFARDVTKNPSYGGGGRFWWPSNWTGLNIFQRRFESLSKRQFAEQIAQTDFGRRLRAMDRSTIKTVLSHAAYQFDRYGVAQTDFFKRRAKVLSGITAFLFVFFANLDAIRLYVHFATDDVALRAAVQQLDSEQLAMMASNQTGDQSDLQAARDILLSLSGQQNLPMGRDFFPFCGSAQKLADSETNLMLVVRDDRCPEFVGRDIVLFGNVIPGTATLSQVGSSLSTEPAEGLKWLLSLIATTGLLALGAPFWFEVFNRVANLVGSAYGLPRKRGREADREPSSGGVSELDLARRSGEEPGSEQLTQAFLISAGILDTPIGGLTPTGGRVGRPSTSTYEQISAPSENVEG